jgi:hypothetical protein
MDEPEIVWEDPPKAERGQRGSIWFKRTALLVAREGNWGSWDVGEVRTARNAVSGLRRASLGWTKRGGKWEFTQRGSRVFGRYLGGEIAGFSP